MEQINLKTYKSNQFLNITSEVEQIIKKEGLDSGICYLFVPHTTAAVTINENADPDVILDLLTGLAETFPDLKEYRHLEGNSSAHLKSSLIGCSLDIPINKSRLCLGKWQGIYFCEFDGPRERKIFIQLIKTI